MRRGRVAGSTQGCRWSPVLHVLSEPVQDTPAGAARATELTAQARTNHQVSYSWTVWSPKAGENPQAQERRVGRHCDMTQTMFWHHLWRPLRT